MFSLGSEHVTLGLELLHLELGQKNFATFFISRELIPKEFMNQVWIAMVLLKTCSVQSGAHILSAFRKFKPVV